MPTLLSMGFLSRLTESATTSSPNTSPTTARPPAAPANVPKKRGYTQEKDNNTAAAKATHKRPRLAAGAAQILSSRPKLFARNGLLSLTSSTALSSSSPSAASSSTSLLPPAATTSSSAATAAAAPTDPRGHPGTGAVPTNSTHAHAHNHNTLNNTHSVAVNSITASITPFDRRNGRHERSTSISASTGANTGTDTGRSTPVEALRRGWNVVRATPDTAGTRAALESSTGDDKRSLRSHDGGSRSRSELAQYFPNWDEIVSNEPQAEEPLTAKTRLHITEEPPKVPSTPSRARQIILPPTSPTQQTPSKLGTGEARVLSPGRSRSSELNTFTTVDFSEQLAAIPRNITKDPLSSEHFRLAHQRGERQEKQLRNIEKEKAQHEKIQLERLYEGLLGHDWLRVMGISGITDTEKKTWEQKRDWVLREVKALLDKFERYREEEKRLRMEREMQMQDSDESDEDDDEEEDSDREVADTEDEEEITIEAQEHRKRRRRTNTDASRDADALAAQQLQSETVSSTSASRTGLKGVRKARKSTGIDVTPLIPLLPPAEEKPFVSFFDKPHLRAAALGGNRRGRSRFAFGHAVPELEEQEFKLPRDMVTDEARKASARMRRLRRRSTKE